MCTISSFAHGYNSPNFCDVLLLVAEYMRLIVGVQRTKVCKRVFVNASIKEGIIS